MRTICPKVSFVNLFVIAVIVDLSGWIYIVDVMCLKLAANVYAFAKLGFEIRPAGLQMPD